MGTRLKDLTKVTNKHLLSIYDRPMIFYPICTLRDAGITDIMIILGGQCIGDFIKLLGSGKRLGVNLTYKIQDEPDGIAGALKLCREFVDNDTCCVILGDNILQTNIEKYKDLFIESSVDAQLHLVYVCDPHRYGVVAIDDNGCVIDIEEKPLNPKSHTIATGIYMYKNSVFDIIDTLKISSRGEFEITDVNREFLNKKALGATMLDGWWVDAGTIESLYRVANLVRAKEGGV